MSSPLRGMGCNLSGNAISFYSMKNFICPVAHIIFTLFILIYLQNVYFAFASLTKQVTSKSPT